MISDKSLPKTLLGLSTKLVSKNTPKLELTDQAKTLEEKMPKNSRLVAQGDPHLAIAIRQIKQSGHPYHKPIKFVHVVVKGKQGSISEDDSAKNVIESTSFLKRKPYSFEINYGDCVNTTLKHSYHKSDITATISVNETLHKTDNSEKPSTSMVKVVPI